jgi:RNA polymerase sigma-70 factor (ECF subfamily)
MLMMELSQAMPITSEMVWTSFSNQLKQFIRKRASNEYDADDILQDVFYKIHLHLSRLNDAHKIESWIYQITRHAIIDYYRNRKHESELPETGLQEENSVLMLDSSDAHYELSKCLKLMVDHLPDVYREAIRLTEFQGMTQKEMGQQLGLSNSGAKSRVQRARSKLQEMLLACCQIDVDRRGTVLAYTPLNPNCAENCSHVKKC